MSTLSQFQGQLRSGGARPSLFKVNLPGQGIPTEKFSFLCKAASLPASTIGPILVPYRGRQLKLAGDRTFADWTLTVINDSDFEIREALENWSEKINSYEKNVGVETPQSYCVDASVDQLDRTEAVTRSYNFYQIWPSELSDIPLAYDSVDTIEEFTVTFQVQWWSPASGIF
ncbi:TPA: hypothetical protein HA278_04145 [Candidatus Woesearchaeota archaeon]|nr:hypothetical protein [Candidatus Woesearchaeota archaeon]